MSDVATAALIVGIALAVQARLQVRLLRRRIASGAGTEVIDPATGLFAEAAAWQCIRAEANRAWRLERPLDIWIGTTSDEATLEASVRGLSFDLPAGSMGIRLAGHRVCVVSCAGTDLSPSLPDAFRWRSRSIMASDSTAQHALTFLTEEVAA